MKEKVHVMAEVRKGSKKDLSSISIESGGETLKDYNNYEDNQNIYDFINGNQNSCFPLRGLDDPNDYDEFRHEFLYIDYGYRRGYTQWQLFLSLFTFHNESANVWSHLIGKKNCFIAVRACFGFWWFSVSVIRLWSSSYFH